MRELGIVVGNDPAALIAKHALCKLRPIGGRERRKLRTEELAQRLRRLLETFWLRQLADIAPDPCEPGRLDHWPDVVEDHASDDGRSGRAEQHGEESAARSSNKNGFADLKRGEHREDIGKLDRQAVVVRIAV